MIKYTIVLAFCSLFFTLQAQKNTFPTMSQAERDKLSEIPDGFAMLNLNTGCLNYYFNQKWREVCGTCTPEAPTLANYAISPHHLVLQIKKTSPQTRYVAYTEPPTQELKDSTGVFHFTKIKNNTFYKINLYAENDCGKSNVSSDTLTFHFEDKCKGETILTDTRNEKKYAIQTIGNACWMAEDLFVKAEKNAEIYVSNEGKVYISQSYLKKQVQEICPVGWHIPTKEEAEDLKENIPLLKDNTFIKGNGAYDFADKTLKVPEYLYFWTTSFSENKEPILAMINQQNMTFIPTKDKMGLSIRCVKDH